MLSGRLVTCLNESGRASLIATKHLTRAGRPVRLYRLAWLQGADAVRPHHFIVLVLDDVAMPDELAGRIELRPHASDLSGIGNHGVLEASLPGLRWRWR